MKIVFFETRADEEVVLKKLLPDNELVFTKEKLSPETLSLVSGAEIVSIFVNSEVREEMGNSLVSAGGKFITTRATGFDNIDVSATIRSKKILVANVPGYGANTVAEFAFSLLLNLARKVHQAYLPVKMEANFIVTGWKGFELFGKTIGIIGVGKIGRNAIKIAKGFGMKVLAYDIFLDQNFAKEVGFEYVPLETLLASSDVVSIHAVYNKGTHHLLNAENIPLMKEGAYLINTARGEIVDTEALVKALNTKKIAGAGLDVLEGERQLKEEAILMAGDKLSPEEFKLMAEDHLLMDMPNVLITPHIAFYTLEAENEIINITVKNILKFIAGTPWNIIGTK